MSGISLGDEGIALDSDNDEGKIKISPFFILHNENFVMRLFVKVGIPFLQRTDFHDYRVHGGATTKASNRKRGQKNEVSES